MSELMSWRTRKKVATEPKEIYEISAKSLYISTGLFTKQLNNNVPCTYVWFCFIFSLPLVTWNLEIVSTKCVIFV